MKPNLVCIARNVKSVVHGQKWSSIVEDLQMLQRTAWGTIRRLFLSCFVGVIPCSFGMWRGQQGDPVALLQRPSIELAPERGSNSTSVTSTIR
jgi:hypothetical protein